MVSTTKQGPFAVKRLSLVHVSVAYNKCGNREARFRSSLVKKLLAFQFGMQWKVGRIKESGDVFERCLTD